MVLTDRQAADMRAGEAVGAAHGTLTHAALSSGGQKALGFRNGLMAASQELCARLVKIYAELDDAAETSTRDELVATIRDRVTAFIKSSVAGQRGAHALRLRVRVRG